MIVVKLSGGLGNQMFQYVFGQYISKKYNSKVEYNIDFYDDQDGGLDIRSYELNKFNIDVPIAKNSFPSIYNKKNKLGKISLLISNFLFNTKDRFFVIVESRYKLLGFFSLLFSNRYFVGYWQDKYFLESFDKEIPKWFILKPQYSEQKEENLANNKNSVSIGVRRGDYVELNATCDIDYYRRAIRFISQKVEQPFFLIFSDDIVWCKENLDLNSYCHKYIDTNIDVPFADMELMSKCKHNIISNSTFGWWGAYLNRNKNKIVISPKGWGLSTQIDCVEL
jgi:hypothetical protein